MPFVYRWRKRGRGNGWPVVAKLTRFVGDSQPILAVVWRAQRGTKAAISEPRPVLLDAQRRGARWLYLRDDRRMRMWRLSITECLRGPLQADGEHYILRERMQACEWRRWEFADEELRLELAPGEVVSETGDVEPEGTRQLALWERDW